MQSRMSSKASMLERQKNWREQDGVVYFSVVSDGMTGKEWVKYFEKKKLVISDNVRTVLLSSNFRPATELIYEVAVLKGDLWSDKIRTTEQILSLAGKRQYSAPRAEVACLIYNSFLASEIVAMGLTNIVVMHKPINGYDGDPALLSINCCNDRFFLGDHCHHFVTKWRRDSGFAFVTSGYKSENLVSDFYCS